MLKSLLLALVLVVALVLAAAADESTCPAHRAAEAGHNPFAEFHGIMAPAWHTAWPAKDYDALLAAGPKFQEMFKQIEAMEPKFKLADRKTAFETKRTEFGKIITEYAAASSAGDKEAVYNLMPKLHDAFEMTASCLLPVYYPQFDGFVITLNLIVENHLPTNNTEGIVGSTETLFLKAEALTADAVPEELQPYKAEIEPILAGIRARVTDLKGCCDKNDMDNYKKVVGELEGEVAKFVEKYI